MFTPLIGLDVLKKSTILRFKDITGVDTGSANKWDGVLGIPSADVAEAKLIITDPSNIISTIDCLPKILAASPILEGDVIQYDDKVGEWPDGFYNVEYQVWMQSNAFTVVTDYNAFRAGTIKITSNNHGLKDGMLARITGVNNSYDGEYPVTILDINNFYIIKAYKGLTTTGTIIPGYTESFSPFVYSNIEMALEKLYATYAAMTEGQEADDYLKMIEDIMGLYNALKYTIPTNAPAIINNIQGRITRILDYYSIELTYK